MTRLRTEDDRAYHETEIDQKIRELESVLPHGDPDLAHLIDEDTRLTRQYAVREKLREIAQLYAEEERLRWAGDSR